MATERLLSDVLTLMRQAIGRRNANDPDSSDPLLVGKINDFYSLKMQSDTKLFENFTTLTFTISEANPTGVYNLDTLEDAGGVELASLSNEAFISLLEPQGSSVSWNILPIWRDPGDFFATWGINNENILIPGYPTEMLFYGNELTFRTIPNTSYQVKIYGYKVNPEFSNEGDPALPFANWLRYIAYGASMDYARDFRYSAEDRSLIKEAFQSERKQMLAHTHNQIKQSRAYPRF